MQLDGVTVLDLTRLLPGPYGTQLLADAGADVLKVEQPGRGDYARVMSAVDGAGGDGVAGTAGGAGAGVFAAVNRGKRSVTLDLKTEAGRDAFYRLAADADAVVESFRPGVAERLGVGYEDVRAYNPEVVYCSLSGFGATGPDRDRPGHDLNYVALAGLLDVTRESPDAPPVIPGYPIADMAGGLFAAFAVLGALVSRELGDGGGEHLDVALTDVVLSFAQPVAGRAFGGGEGEADGTPRAGETPLTGEYPCYDVYEAADGGYVTLAALEPQFWAAFCEAVDRPDLVDDHLAADPAVRERVRTEVAEAFATRTREEWEDALGGAEAMVAPVASVREAVEDPRVRERDLVRDEAGPPRIGLPALSSTGSTNDGPVPDLGEHTEAVLREHGFDDDDLALLREADAI